MQNARVCACARRHMHSFCHVLDLYVHRRCYQNMMKAWADYSSDDVNPSPDTTFSSSGVSTTPRPPSCVLSRHVLCFPNVGNRACPRVSPDLFPPRKTSDSFFADPILQHAFGHPHQQMKYSHEQTRHLSYPYQQQPHHHLPGLC